MNYREIILGVEDGLKKMKMTNISTDDFKNRLEKFKHFNYIHLDDNEIFWMLTYIMFFNMGKKASMIEKKLPIFKPYLYGYEKLTKLSQKDIDSIISNTGFEKQINWVISNAIVFNTLVKQKGSFKEYMENKFGIKDIYCSSQQLSYLYNDLRIKFKGIGETAGWHFITELGFFSLKPDSVIRRIFYRLGLISNEDNLTDAIEVGRKISKELNIPIRYLDIIFVKFGQVGQSDLLGTVDGMCTENNPKCYMCSLKNMCKYNSDEIKYKIIDRNDEYIKSYIKTDIKNTKYKLTNSKNTFKEINGDIVWELDEFMDIIKLYFGKESNVFEMIRKILNALEQVKGKVQVKKRKGNDAVIRFKQGGNIVTFWFNNNSITIRVVGDEIFDKPKTIYDVIQLEKYNAIDIITKKAKLT